MSRAAQAKLDARVREQARDLLNSVDGENRGRAEVTHLTVSSESLMDLRIAVNAAEAMAFVLAEEEGS